VLAGRGLAWLTVFPLVAAGSLTAHELAYRLAVPSDGERARVLAETGHGYLDLAPAVMACAAALAAAALVLVAAGARRGGPDPRLAARGFFALPPLAYAIQELLERVQNGVELSLAALAEPTFGIGLLLQLPFALAALLLARGLLRVARRIGRALASPRIPPPLPPLAIPHPAAAEPPARSALAFRLAGRGPPPAPAR
jgi:hypothetical protein